MEDLDRVSLNQSQDGWEWDLNGGNDFTVASARMKIDMKVLEVEVVATRWNRVIPSRLNVFGWRLRLNRLPTKVNLDRRGIELGPVLCPMCGDDVETVNHIFFTCEVAVELW